MYQAASRSTSRETSGSTDKKRPRKPPPNQVWLDAIMSKARSTEPSPSSTISDVPPPTKQMRRMTANTDEETWPTPTPTQTVVRSTRSSRTPSPAVQIPPPSLDTMTANPFIGQLAVDDMALVAAMTTSLKDMVAEQDCSFIARGYCHLCSDKEKKLVPVVNFCPEFSATHSLCREHLRSMHRVRLVDIFAGKNQPTVSKRALRCTVCSLSCPCSKCQLRRDAEILKYKEWLAGPSPNGDSSGIYEGDNDSVMPPRTRSHRSTPPPADSSEGTGTRRRGPPSHRSSMGSDVSDPHLGHAEEKRSVPDRRMYYGGEEKPVSDVGDGLYGMEDGVTGVDGVLTATLRADEKGGGRGNRFPKRAAKELVPYPLDSSNAMFEQSAPIVENTPDLSSPSAASVLNCPDSEKSLVDLLSSLNQRVTPAVRYFADANEPRFRDMMEGGPRGYDRDQMERVHANTTNYGQDKYETSVRRQKRKRDILPSNRANEDVTGYDMDEAQPGRDTPGVHFTVSTRGDDTVPSYRQKAPAPLAAVDRKLRQAPPSTGKPPSPSPRGRLSGKAKGTTVDDTKASSTRKRDPPTTVPMAPPSSTRKRKSDTLAPPPVSTERRTPRGTAHRGRAHKPSPVSNHRNLRNDDDKEEEVIEGDDDDESELDTNLDYCEVCLAAGDLVCCDVCPRSFHLKCLKMTENDLPEGDWQCAECRKPSYFESFGAAVATKPTVQAKCLQIIRCLKSHPFSKPFLLPVENVPHYTNIVKQPMDLTTIEKKLIEHKYMVPAKSSAHGSNGSGKTLHLGSFAEDVRLVWSNCKLFNDDGSGITRAADQLSEGFEKLYRDVLDFVDRGPAKPTTSGRREEPKPATQTPDSTQLKGQDSVTSLPTGSKPSEPKTTGTTLKHAEMPVTSQSQGDVSNKNSENMSSQSQPNATAGENGGSRTSTGTNASAATTMSSTATTASGKSSSSASTTEVDGVAVRAEKSTPGVSSSTSTARSASPSAVTTTTTTPLPTESATKSSVPPEDVTNTRSTQENDAQKSKMPASDNAASSGTLNGSTSK